MRKLIALIFAGLALVGCGSVQNRIESNNDFAINQVNKACEALTAFPVKHAECVAAEKNAFVDCYAEKVKNRVMPSEALAICRVAVDSKGKLEPTVSANPRDGDQRFGVNPSYGYPGYAGAGYPRGNGGYNGSSVYTGNTWGGWGGPSYDPGIRVIPAPRVHYGPTGWPAAPPIRMAPIPNQPVWPAHLNGRPM